ALPSSFGLLHMGTAIDDFLKLHPQIKFELDFNDREVNLVHEGFDLALRIANLPDSSLIARRLTEIKLVICASPAYLKKRGTPHTLTNLAQHQCLLYSLMRDGDVWQFDDQEGNIERVKLTAAMRANSGDFLKEAALADRGIVFLPTFMVYQDIRAGRLTPLLTHYKPFRLSAYALYPQTHHLSKRVRAFVDFLAKRFAGIPYWDQ
ncbi:MAG: substrate binding domain-containing protein, partial [Gammaproteobacteria bacterium]|nr:substrate binding domain-containing protein [Gammaproteobacteria bacterium]